MRLAPGYDLAYSLDSTSELDFNTGFYAARASHNTVDLFKRTAKVAIDHNCTTGNQAYMRGCVFRINTLTNTSFSILFYNTKGRELWITALDEALYMNGRRWSDARARNSTVERVCSTEMERDF